MSSLFSIVVVFVAIMTAIIDIILLGYIIENHRKREVQNIVKYLN